MGLWTDSRQSHVCHPLWTTLAASACGRLCWSHCLRGRLIDNSNIYVEVWCLRGCLKNWERWGIKIVRNSHSYIHFYTESPYVSFLQRTTHRLLIQPSDLIENIHLGLINQNQEVKTGALCTASSTSICSLTVQFLIKMPCILLQLGRRNRRYVDGVGFSKRTRLGEVTSASCRCAKCWLLEWSSWLRRSIMQQCREARVSIAFGSGYCKRASMLYSINLTNWRYKQQREYHTETF
jgi:hypothetical protein